MKHTVQLGSKTITLIGTAHISEASSLEVLTILNEIQPDTVAIELDEARYQSLQSDKQWQNTDVVNIIKSKKVGFLMSQIVLSSYQKKMAKQLNIEVGQEMLTAIEYSQDHATKLLKIDRSIQTTFMRIWRSLNFFDKMKMLTALITSVFETEEVSVEQIEAMKQQDLMESALSEVSKAFPKIANTLITERDRVMASNLKASSATQVVAVVGAAHIPGILKYLEIQDDVSELFDVPSPKKSNRYLTYLFPLFLTILIVLNIYQSNDMGLNTLWRFFLINGSLSALGTLLAFGHPLSILTAFVMAPIGVMSPVLATGWFAVLMEAYVRKPKVADFMTIQEDVMHLKGFWKNKVIHILMVVIFANVFASLGSIVYSIDLIKNLFK